jgi:hypothetical protein
MGMGMAMPDRYLLYIDMLGFSDLVLRRGAVKQLYSIIDSLNVHGHHAFKTIAFSDTLLVYNTFEPETDHDRHYAIMYMCEFAKDLHYKLVPLDLHFRGFLTKGEFAHVELRHMQAFYGAALIFSYRREKNIDCTGLFLDAPLLPDCDIFFYEQYDQNTYFIHLMQALNSLRFPEVDYPIDPILVGEAKWDLAYDFRYLRNIHRHMNDPDLHPRIRSKHAAAWNLIRRRYQAILDTLEAQDFDPRSISVFDWSDATRHLDVAEGILGP